MSISGSEWHTQVLQKSFPFIVRPSRCDDRNIHPMDRGDFIVLDFREDKLLFQAKRIVPPTIKGLRRDAAEVSYSGKRQRHQPIKKLIHPSATERHFGTDW